MGRGGLLLLLVAVWVPAPLHAQTHATALESLSVQIWPDYDQPSVLVLLTGTLASETSLPALVTLPVPPEARLNAVARIDSADRMIDDVPHSSAGGELVLTTPDPRFRVEYYVPYQAEGDARSFSFRWRSSLSVGQLSALVQKPGFATSLVTEPAAVDVVQGKDGLSYHALPATSVPAGGEFTLRVSYPVSASRLSVERVRREPAPGDAGAAAPRESEDEGGLGWAAVATGGGALILAGVFAWQLARSRSARPAAPAPPGSPPSQAGRSEVRFCSACGEAFGKADRFCRHCGAARA